MGVPGISSAVSGVIHRPAQRFTKAGDWYAARLAGKRLPEHALDTDRCPLCDSPLDTARDCEACRSIQETM